MDRPSADAAGLPLHLSFTPDRADFEALYATARTPFWQPAASFVGFFAIGILVGWAGDNVPLIRTILTWSKYSLAALLVVFIVAGHAAVLALRRLFRRLRAARAAAAAGPVEFAAYDDFVDIAEGGHTDIYPWREVLSARLGRGHVFLVVTGRRRLVLPRRAFADDAAMDAFAQPPKSVCAWNARTRTPRPRPRRRPPDEPQPLATWRRPPPSQRQLRVGELIRHAIAEILQRGEVHDPASRGLVVTVPEVRMTPDLRLATVFVMPLGGKDADTLLAALDRHRKFLRGEVAHRVNLRYAPELRFRLDNSFDEGERIDSLLRSPEVKRDLDGE